LHQHAWCHLEKGETEAALEGFLASTTAKDLGDVRGVVDFDSVGASAHEVGHCLFVLGRHTEAMQWFERAADAKSRGVQADGTVDLAFVAHCQRRIGDCLLHLDRPWEARSAMDRAVRTGRSAQEAGQVGEDFTALLGRAAAHARDAVKRAAGTTP
jgi:tetratricopeptide (TPR) repeat protein